MKITTEETIQKFKNKHGNLYDYSLVEYTTAKTKCKIICEEHDIFEMSPNNHLSGYGCPRCKNKGYSDEERLYMFIQHANEIHEHNYDYSLVKSYIKSSSPIYVLCNKHGAFSTSVFRHITNKSGCPDCGTISHYNKTSLTLGKFISKSKIIHGDYYNYDKTHYVGAHKKVIITCPKHGDFSVTPANHWSNGIGCPTCQHSNPTKGETKVFKWLTEHNIKFVMQKTFPSLIYKSSRGRLKYDFFLPDLNILIEFDGEQHYVPISFSKSRTAEEQFKITQDCDKLKNEYAFDNGYKLFRIRYDQDVDEFLNTNLL